MPNLKTHKALSIERTGRSFEELHRWIDERQKDLGSEHRSKRHYWSRETKRYIQEYWNRKEKGLGTVAVEEWLFHITLDNIYTLYKYHKRNNPMREHKNLFLFGILDNGYIKYKEKALGDKKINYIFSKISGETAEAKAFNDDIEEIFE